MRRGRPVQMTRSQNHIIISLRLARLSQDLTQADLAKKLGRSRESLARWEAGLVNPPSLWMVEKWAKALGYEVRLAPHGPNHPGGTLGRT
jgi:transcriptional regulator with XRE-family HTH domain